MKHISLTASSLPVYARGHGGTKEAALKPFTSAPLHFDLPWDCAAGCSSFLNIQSVTPEDSFFLDSFLSLPSRADLGRALWLFRLIRAGSVSLEGTASPLRLRPPASLQARMGKLWLYHLSVSLWPPVILCLSNCHLSISALLFLPAGSFFICIFFYTHTYANKNSFCFFKYLFYLKLY